MLRNLALALFIVPLALIAIVSVAIGTAALLGTMP